MTTLCSYANKIVPDVVPIGLFSPGTVHLWCAKFFDWPHEGPAVELFQPINV